MDNVRNFENQLGNNLTQESTAVGFLPPAFLIRGLESLRAVTSCYEKSEQSQIMRLSIIYYHDRNRWE